MARTVTFPNCLCCGVSNSTSGSQSDDPGCRGWYCCPATRAVNYLTDCAAVAAFQEACGQLIEIGCGATTIQVPRYLTATFGGIFAPIGTVILTYDPVTGAWISAFPMGFALECTTVGFHANVRFCADGSNPLSVSIVVAGVTGDECEVVYLGVATNNPIAFSGGGTMMDFCGACDGSAWTVDVVGSGSGGESITVGGPYLTQEEAMLVCDSGSSSSSTGGSAGGGAGGFFDGTDRGDDMLMATNPFAAAAAKAPDRFALPLCRYEGAVLEYASCGCEGRHVRNCDNPYQGGTDPEGRAVPEIDRCVREHQPNVLQSCERCPYQKAPEGVA